jgi:DNA-binding GntR family transcriptional regulator
MAEILGMSRTPVREALVRLDMEGWIHLIPRRGFIVSTILEDDLRQIYEVVEVLDGVAGRLATGRATSQQLNHLEFLIQEQKKALENDNLIAWTDLDDQFHSYIVDLAENPRLRGIMDSQSDQLYRARLYTIKYRPKPTRSITEHTAILAIMRASELTNLPMDQRDLRAQNRFLKPKKDLPMY